MVFSHLFVVPYRLFVATFHFIAILSCLFAYKRHFLGHFAFLKIFTCFVFRLFTLVIASHFHKNGVAIHKFSIIFAFWITMLALLSRNDGQRKCTLSFRNDGAFCHFERSD